MACRWHTTGWDASGADPWGGDRSGGGVLHACPGRAGVCWHLPHLQRGLQEDKVRTSVCTYVCAA